MNKLISQLQRLYFLPDQQGSWLAADQPAVLGRLPEEALSGSLHGAGRLALDPVSPSGLARSLVVEFRRAADWPQVAELYQALQEEFELPAPAISVSGRSGYRLWLSLAEARPLAEIRRFLDALQQHYLAAIPEAGWGTHPASPPVPLPLAPALNAATGKWSAFIDPSMGEMFVSEPGLEMAPNPDRQADLLSRIKSIASQDFQRALVKLEGKAALAEASETASQPADKSNQANPAGHVGSHYSDPQSFLLAVINDPAASTRDRIEAAKALLPYFGQAPVR